MKTQIDHIVIGAANLKQGAEYVQEKLGVTMPQGGEHPLMGTHNLLMQLGNNVFIEVITINPDAASPNRPRWYGLDDTRVSKQLIDAPRLLTWVVNTDNISALACNAEFSLGHPTPVSRGDLSWHFAIPDDGRLLAGGLIPYVMQWHSAPHPGGSMPDLGCRFNSVTIRHPHPAWIKSVLNQMGAEQLAAVEQTESGRAPSLEISLKTPNGEVVLSNE